MGAYSRLLPGAPAFSCCAEHNVQLSLVIYIPRYLHQVYFSTQAPRTRGRGAGVLHPRERGQGTRRHTELSCTLPNASPKTVRSPTCSPKGARDPTPFTSCFEDPAGHVPAPGAASPCGTSCSLYGCGELQGAVARARAFQGGVNSHMSPSLTSLLCSNAHVCLVGLWMLSRTGNGWDGQMSCAEGWGTGVGHILHQLPSGPQQGTG